MDVVFARLSRVVQGKRLIKYYFLVNQKCYSRFTSSVKYEEHFERCFQLTEARRGEICNACVLLVKRFKKLPSGTCRHWGHVVDARAGPGVKNFVRERRRESCRERCFKKKHVYKKRLSSVLTSSPADKSEPSQGRYLLNSPSQLQFTW